MITGGGITPGRPPGPPVVVSSSHSARVQKFRRLNLASPRLWELVRHGLRPGPGAAAPVLGIEGYRLL